MPAKPLQSVQRDAKFIVNPAALSELPELAALISRIIAEWAQAEANLGTVLTILSGAKAKPAAAMYGSLKSPQARVDTLRSVARVTLKRDVFGTFNAVLIYLRTGADLRNQLAHGLWGSSSKVPKALLVMDADVGLTKFRNSTDALYSKSENDELHLPAIHPKDVYVYFKPDLEEALQHMERCYAYTQALCTLVAPETVAGEPAGITAPVLQASARIHEWLLAQPPLQKDLKKAKPPAPSDIQAPPP